MSMLAEMSSVESETAMLVDTSECKRVADGKEALAKFWSGCRLSHKSEQLKEWLGTETVEDLDCVYPHDLNTIRADQWLQATLTIAEGNRLKKAVSQHYARMITAEDASAGFVAVWQAEKDASGCVRACACHTQNASI
jgi:hypothetical protein